MNQPTKTEVIGAVKWVVEFITDHISEDEADDVGRAQEVVRILRAALEQYQKPKTVSREWVRILAWELVALVDAKRPIVGMIERKLKEKGIEVEGPSPDDKS